MFRLVFLLSFVLLASGASAQIAAVDAAPGADLTFPLDVAFAPGQPERLYVVEKGEDSPRHPSRIVSIGPDETELTVFLDVSPKVWPGGEAGLYSLVFHPDYEVNGRFFLYYTARGEQRTTIEEYTRSVEDPLVADPASGRVILDIPQSIAVHNGGTIAFGPDGYLYLGLGDGEGQGDIARVGQDLSSILSTFIRIDVDDAPEGETYRIPEDNPFRGVEGAREEVYAYGFRNPWRFSFDSETGDLWTGDVGAAIWEEIDVVRAGGNYGWSEVEGPDCFREGCDPSAYDAPIHVYRHGAGPGEGFSVTGGFVYRGSALPGLQGRYLFSDFVLPRLWALEHDLASGSSSAEVIVSTIPNVAAIKEGPDGEPYVVSFQGTVYRLVSDPTAVPTGPASGGELRISGPNPVADRTTLTASASGGTSLRVTALDALGRELGILYDGTMPASGEIDLGFDASGLAPGVVLVVMETSTFRAVQRLVIAR